MNWIDKTNDSIRGREGREWTGRDQMTVRETTDQIMSMTTDGDETIMM